MHVQVRHFALHVLENVLRVRWLSENDASNQLGKGGQREQQQALKPPVSEPGQVCGANCQCHVIRHML